MCGFRYITPLPHSIFCICHTIMISSHLEEKRNHLFMMVNQPVKRYLNSLAKNIIETFIQLKMQLPDSISHLFICKFVQDDHLERVMSYQNCSVSGGVITGKHSMRYTV